LAIAAYNTPAGPDDPSGQGAAQCPRTAILIRYDGTIDLSTRLTDSFDFTGIRAATTTNGTQIWLAGDNASGATASGGTRYTTRGGNASENLSQVQAVGGAQTPDNIRDLQIFGNQLYNSSGSSSSVGKAVFKVGDGLPTSGSQALTLLTSDAASVSSFYFL